MASTATTSTETGPRLRRTLTLWDLILYGVIVIQPVAPMSVFGVLSARGHGHVVTTILIAMVWIEVEDLPAGPREAHCFERHAIGRCIRRHTAHAMLHSG